MYHKIRKTIFKTETYKEKQKLKGEIEVDASYFGTKRIRGKRRREVKGKTDIYKFLLKDFKENPF